ncbi:biotin-dependent carboxyltransferase family protein [Nocardioides sp.]|uniref:5-oxoprolinase subunit C family protein n=1 Tax=Nocardioides sp. TaxID=35761 RepID=UPI003D12A13B
MSSTSIITVLDPGVLTTVQDEGRPGFAHLGVPRAGALDVPAAALANRIVGNGPSAAVLETVLGGLRLRSDTGVWIAVTGAPVPLSIDGRPRGVQVPEWVPAGAEVSLGTPDRGVRSYVAVAGGFAVPEVLGSRSTDTLSGVGPPPLVTGQELPVGASVGEIRAHDTPRGPAVGPLRLLPGPRRDWFADSALDVLCAGPYSVLAESNRVGLRLTGERLPRVRDGELASEGMVFGAIQVPPDGMPVVLLNDHPVTGGYPVIAVVEPGDLWQCAQLRPGEAVRFTHRR